MYSGFRNGEVSSEEVHLSYISLDAIVDQTSLCIFIVVFEPAVFDESMLFMCLR